MFDNSSYSKYWFKYIKLLDRLSQKVNNDNNLRVDKVIGVGPFFTPL
jgi:hypothetical protein